jgi:hypothetical protein
MEGAQTAASASSKASSAPSDGALASSSASASPPASAVPPPPPLAAPPPPPDWKLTLVSPGDEPRKALRYALRAGAKEAATMDMRTAASVSIDGTKKDLATPPVTMTVSLVSEGTTAKNELDYKFTLDAIDLAKDSDPAFAPYRSFLQKVIGASGEMQLTPQGRADKKSVALPPGAGEQAGEVTDQLVGALRDTMVPFPDEPVGKGAQWKVTMAFTVKPVVAARTTTFTLTSVAGTKGTIEATEDIVVPPQTISTPDGQRADLQSMKGSGTRKVAFDLGKIVPTSTWDLSVDSVQTQWAQDGPHPIQGHSQILLNLAPKK